MFAANSGGRSLRSTRRRQRTSLDEAVKPPNAKRQRSTLRQGSGEGPVKTIANGDLQDNQQPADVDQQDSNDDKIKAEQNQQNIAFRGPRKHEKPAGQTDPTVTLSSNDYYTVTKLPLPEQLLDFISGRARCVFNTKTGFALLLTESRALVWSYSTGASQLDSETLPLSIPEWCTSDDTALMGTLVSNVTNAIPGLLVVAPSTGKLIYWESASNAAFVGIAKQKQSGLRGAIPGLLSGEHVTDVINAEPSGIILVLSSGRVAQVTMRDPQGKPGLTVNFLHRGYTNGGFFDGLRNVLGSGSWRKEIAGVRTGASLVRGQRDIYILSSSGLLEIWDSHWNNVNTLRAEIDIQGDIYQSLGLATDAKPNYSMRILDFVASHEESKTPQSGEVQQNITLFFLALMSQGPSTKILAVVKAETHHDSVEILSSHIIENPNIVNELETHKPKLHITRPSNTAFIVIGQKVWIVSILGLEPTPSAQLLDGGISKPFQDRVQFQSGDKYEIIGTGSNAEGMELENPTCILMLRGYGLISISALSSQLEDGGVASVTAKQKIEQAVFYGTMTNTPLSFNDDGEPTFSVEELEYAALEICNDVLQSNARFIPHATMSIDHNLRLRSKAMSDLAAELLRRRVALSRRVRWELLWAGEKLAAQRAIWKLEEEFQKTWKPETFLSRAIGLMNEKFKTKHDSIKTSEKDHVRQWFFHDTFQMQHIIPWIFNAIRGSKGPGGRTSAAFLAQVYQASELSLAALESAFRFREDHALQYGLGEEAFENGVLLSSYADLPEFWTSENMVYSETGSMLDLELESSRSWQQPTSNSGQPDSDMLPQIAKNSCRRLYVLNMMLEERTQWLSAQNDPKLKEEGISMKETNHKQRQWQLYKMAGIGQLQGAISLAEEFRDMGALVELMVELQDQIKNHEADAEAKSLLPLKDMSSFSQKIGEYFNSFGEQWADAFFSRQIKVGQPGVLLSMKDYQVHVTRFLRKFPSYSRLAWVNDILGEQDYKTASDALEKLALTQEANLWDKRVQLSLAKITKLASWEQTASLDKSENKIWRRRMDELGELAGIQELLYEHILPAMHGAIDPKAELELAMEHFGNRVSDRPALKEVLEELLARLIRGQALNAEQLINLITLMDNDVQFLEGEESEAFNREFFIALRVLRLSDYATSDPAGYNYLQKLIWRRCITRDDWCTILKSQSQSDDDRKSLLRGTALVKTLAECMAEESSQRTATDDLYRLGQPSEVIQFGSYELIRNRFRAEQWPHIERDLNLEIDNLRRFIEEGQLDLWYPELLKLVQEDFAGMRTH